MFLLILQPQGMDFLTGPNEDDEYSSDDEPEYMDDPTPPSPQVGPAPSSQLVHSPTPVPHVDVVDIPINSPPGVTRLSTLHDLDRVIDTYNLGDQRETIHHHATVCPFPFNLSLSTH